MFVEVLICPCSYGTTVSITSVRTNDGLDLVGLDIELLFGVVEKLLNFFFENVFWA